MNTRFMVLALVLCAVSATAHAQGKGGTVHKGTKQEAKQAEATYAQCIYNQAGYVAKIQWFSQGTLTYTKSGDTFNLKATKPPFKNETILLGQSSCVGGKGTRHAAVVAVKDGKYARIAAIAATDVAAFSATAGCIVGAAALTVVTAGAGAAAGAGCEALADLAISVASEPSMFPDAKEIFAVVSPPASNGLNPPMVVMYGTVFNPQTKVARLR